MILVLAGTKESREIIKRLEEIERQLIASVVTEYGHQLLEQLGVTVIKKRLDRQAMSELIEKEGINLVIDATHPFAQQVSKIAQDVCNDLAIDYLRFERKEVEITEQELIIEVVGYNEAAKKANNFNKILLTVGSKNLNYFVEEIKDWQTRLLARVLPTAKFIARAEKLGFNPSNLIAIQGPFSKEMNQILLKDYKIDVLVTKASGKIGGLETKLAAAFELEIPVILIKRPKAVVDTTISDYEQLINKIKERED